MQLVRGLYNLGSDLISGCVATIGNYDGVHLGHQKILSYVKTKAIELKLKSVAIIFEPQPEEFFTRDRSLRLTSLREKFLLLKENGIDIVLLLPFNDHLASLTAKQFITVILVNKLRVKHIVIGDDFVFGHRRKGDYLLLNQEKERYGFQITQLPPSKIDGVRVSSSLIRTALIQGDLELATKFLGRPYRISGRIMHGDHRGRDLGFPTANIYLKRQESPLTGVYAVKIYDLTPNLLSGIANIGFRPTVAGKHKSYEVYIFNFSSDIYSKRVVIEFHKKIRDEQKFNSLIELQSQIKKDLEMAKSLL
ncbi:MAG: bifunctional riboflavin kinase/FAD synthetase [Coxiellaceae bacterium]|jgi:riboflavin kinase/FMN adenylyltransferase|nr:bifunctional riboflavin kinase/FAD synthetase [Coxiellaceae bacterium]